MKERIDYRVQKWFTQQLTTGRTANQFERLETIDWDLVIVLDACRVDSLRRAANWPIDTVISPASCTPQWLQQITSSGVFADTHIVSGNPQYEKIESKEETMNIERIWETSWDTHRQTVLPEPILDRTSEIRDDGHRVVAHLQQPHWPYVAKLDDTWLLAYDDLGPWQSADGDIESLQVAMQRGLIDTKRANRAYEASVKSIWETLIPYLIRWIEQEYTIVVTADHGETFGRIRDLRFYEHPCGCHLPPLVRVPWVKFQPTQTTEKGDKIEDRLRALGYAD